MDYKQMPGILIKKYNKTIHEVSKNDRDSLVKQKNKFIRVPEVNKQQRHKKT